MPFSTAEELMIRHHVGIERNPSEVGIEAYRLTSLEIDDRLVAKQELVFDDRIVQRLGPLEVFLDPACGIPVEHDRIRRSRSACPRTRNLSCTEQQAGVVALPRGEGDSCSCRYVVARACSHDRLVETALYSFQEGLNRGPDHRTSRP